MFEAYGFIAAENDMNSLLKQSDFCERSSDSVSSSSADNNFESEMVKKVEPKPLNYIVNVPQEKKQDI